MQDFGRLSAEAILRIGKEVSMRQTQEDFVPDGQENVYIYTRDGRKLLDFFAGAGALWAGGGERLLKLLVLERLSRQARLMRSGASSSIRNVIKLNFDDIVPSTWQDDPNYPQARIFAASVLQQVDELFVPDADCYTVPGTTLKWWLAKKIFPWKRPMVVGLYCEGSRANEGAVKPWYDGKKQTQDALFNAWAKQRPERNIVLALSVGREEGAFAGRTLGALSFNASKEVHRRHFPTAFRSIQIPYPLSQKGFPDPRTYIKILDSTLDRGLTELGASRRQVQGLHLELVLGEGGFYEADRDLVYALEEWRKKNDFLLLLDEIQTGMCWTGTMLALEQYPELDPDAVTLGKALAGGAGLPLSAAIIRQDLNYEEFGRDSSTFGGYQAAAAAAIATLEWMTDKKWWEKTAAMGSYIRSRLEEVFGKYPHLLDPAVPFSGLGMMQGVGFRSKAVRDFVKKRALEKGLFIEGTGLKRLRVRPPQIITREQVDEGLAILEEVLREAA